MDSAIYLGRPGSLRKLFDPTGGMVSTLELGSSVFSSGDGGSNVSKALNGPRQFSLNYGALGRANFEYLNAMHLGHMGTGPFVLLDPGRRNLLTANQSSATSLTNDTRDFTVAGTGGSISSDSTLTSIAFPRCLKWSFATSTPAAASLLLDKPSSVWYGIPVVSRPYCFWCLVLGGTGAINFQLSLKWMGLTGSTLSTSLSSTYTSSTSSWLLAKIAVTTPPAGSVWVQPGVAPDVSTIASGESLYFTDLHFNEGDQPDPMWAPGTGVYPVQIVTLPEQYGFAEPGMIVSPTLTLRELR
jgi:hypothetical protein